MKNALRKALSDFARELEAMGFRYVLIGGLAASLRGRVRATEDIDVIVLCSVEEALELTSSLRQSNFLPLIDNFEQVARSALLIPLVHGSTKVQLDVAIGLSGFEQQIIERADPIFVGQAEIQVATGEDLILLKALAGRPQDEQDIRGIIELHSDDIDWHYCLSVAERLQDAVGVDLVKKINSLRQT